MTNPCLHQPPSFDDHQFRLGQLETWRELAVRPTLHECHPDDMVLLDQTIDDLSVLSERCQRVRNLMNELIPISLQPGDAALIPRLSNIPRAGLGLFYDPCPNSSDEEFIARGVTFCYMTGHIHNYRSAQTLADRSYLLLLLGDALVDSAPLLQVKARYINDPLNDLLVNCKFVPERNRAAVVATRDIHRGEELLVSYGPGYWSQQATMGQIMSVSPQHETTR